MGKVLKFRGTVSTNRVRSECTFEFEIDEGDLSKDPSRREQEIDRIALDELWNSGQLSWGYEQIEEEES